MESLEGVFKIIKVDAWMASVDIKDAFFTILVHSFIKNTLNLNGLINSTNS